MLIISKGVSFQDLPQWRDKESSIDTHELSLSFKQQLRFITLTVTFLLSTWMRGYLFQCLYKTRSYSLKDYEAVFLKIQNSILSVVAGSI